MRFVTNTTRRPHREVFERLLQLGFDVEVSELFTPAIAARRILADLGAKSIAPFFPEASFVDFSAFELVGGSSRRAPDITPDTVVLGDLGDEWSPRYLNEAFRYVMDGAGLVALQKGRFWQSADGLRLDAGPFVAAVEYATGQQAVVCGKPAAPFFEAIIKSLRLPVDAAPPVMVGDDLWNDIGGAQRAGLRGWLVRTGKFREGVLAASEVHPDRVIGSVVEIIDTLD
jgi:HAD superfamily hydrolase (TIGR01458 family)